MAAVGKVSGMYTTCWFREVQSDFSILINKKNKNNSGQNCHSLTCWGWGLNRLFASGLFHGHCRPPSPEINCY